MRRVVRTQARLRVLSCILLLMLVSCTSEQMRLAQKKYGKHCTISSHTWRGRWWDYYERGISCAAGKYWPEAINDFKSAIQQRPKDERRVRTYAILMINEYLPHRELGIAYFHTGQYANAIRELETSLQTVATSKAKFYLNNARRALFKQAGYLKGQPHIVLENSPNNLVTNLLSVNVKGYAQGDAYIATLTINGQEQFIDLAKEKYSFSKKVLLQAGRNTIAIIATDLLGQPGKKTLIVEVDREGPLVSIEQVEVHGNQVRIRGQLSDDTRVTRFALAGRPVLPQPTNLGTFDTEIQIPQGMASLPFEAGDEAGNTTMGRIALKSTGSEPPGTREGKASGAWRTRWTSLFPDNMVADLVAFSAAQNPPHTPRDPPAIRVFKPEGGKTFSKPEISLRLLFRRGASAITAFSISHNGRLLSAQKGSWLKSPGAVGIFFERYVILERGKNTFNFEVSDALDRMIQRQIVVTYKGNQARLTDYRLHVLPMVLPEHKISPDDHIPPELAISPGLARQIHLAFPNALRTMNRFRIVEERFRLRSANLYFSKSDIANIGKNVESTEAVLAIRAYRTSPGELELVSRVIDVDDEVEILEHAQSYVKNLDRSTLHKVIEDLSKKVVKSFPIVEGGIINIIYPEKTLVLNISEKDGIRPHMKLVVFREGREYIENGRTYMDQGEIIGEARINPALRRQVQQSIPTSKAHMLKSKLSEVSKEVRVNDKVITK